MDSPMDEAKYKASKKVQLTSSMLRMFAGCGVAFQRRYGERFGIGPTEEIIPPGVAAIAGTGVHKSIEANLTAKMDTGEPISREQINDIARDAVRDEWDSGVMLHGYEAVNPTKTLGETQDKSIRLAGLHYSMLAPQIVPLALEEPFVIVLDNYPYNLSGRKDIREDGTIRDTKTSATSSTLPADGDVTMQMAMYALDEQVQGRPLPRVITDGLIDLKAGPALRQRSAVVTKLNFNPLYARIERAIETIEAIQSGHAAAMPCDPTHWGCTMRWCGYAPTCPFWSGREK